MAQSEMSKAVKRINFTIAQFIKQGLTNTREYKTWETVLNKLSQNDVKLSTTKAGAPKIVNTKELEKLDQRVKDYILAKSHSVNTVGTANKRARAILKANKVKPEKGKSYTEKQIKEILEMNSRVHEIIKEKASAVYGMEIQGTISVRKEYGGGGSLTLQEMKDILSIDKMSKAQLKKLNETYLKDKTAKIEERLKKLIQDDAVGVLTGAEFNYNISDIIRLIRLKKKLNIKPQHALEMLQGNMLGSTAKQINERTEYLHKHGYNYDAFKDD